MAQRPLKVTECMLLCKTLAAGETEQANCAALRWASSLCAWAAMVQSCCEQLLCGTSFLKPLLIQHRAAHSLRSNSTGPSLSARGLCCLLCDCSLFTSLSSLSKGIVSSIFLWFLLMTLQVPWEDSLA